MSLRLIIFLTLTSAIASSNNLEQQFRNQMHGGDYCDTEVFRAECGQEEVIMLNSVSYGRMKLGRCVEISLGYLGCSADVTAMADRRCSGKRVCEIRVPDAEFESTGPCLKELKTYLQATYFCLPVITLASDHCDYSMELNITQSSGFISSLALSEFTSCDPKTHPWVIQGKPGQRVNLTLYNFDLDTRYTFVRESNDSTNDPSQELRIACHEYGMIQDSGSGALTSICKTDKRIAHLLKSQGHMLKIWITAVNGPKDLSRFVIGYQIIGCVDPTVVPDNSVFIRTSESDGHIDCLYSDNSWPLHCIEDDKWKGHVGNCSLPAAEKFDDFTNKPTPLFLPASYILWLGIVTGSLLISILSIILLIVINRRRK